MPESSFWTEWSVWDGMNTICVSMVLIGVIGELAVGFRKPPKNPYEAFDPRDPSAGMPVALYKDPPSWELKQSTWERSHKRWNNVWTALVAVGLALELLSFFPELQETIELKKQAEKANTEAEKARKETLEMKLAFEKYKAPRTLTPGQEDRFKSFLKERHEKPGWV